LYARCAVWRALVEVQVVRAAHVDEVDLEAVADVHLRERPHRDQFDGVRRRAGQVGRQRVQSAVFVGEAMSA